MEDLTTTEIFIFSLGNATQQSLFQIIHDHLMQRLASNFSLKQATSAQDALQLFERNDTPKGILVTDPGIIAPKNDAVSRKISDYVRNGGTLVLGCLFSGEIRPNDLKKYMRERWDLPWEAGSYHRTTLHLNQDLGDLLNGRLQSSYSQKALFLKHVDPTAAWYVASDRSVVESLVALPGQGIDLLETPVAFASVDKGRVGYVGDVNGEKESDLVILEMLGWDV